MKRIKAVAGFVSNNPRTSATLALVALAALFVAWQFGAGIVAGVRDALGRREVAGQVRAAEGVLEQARDAQRSADAEGVERRVEDRIRAEVIEPERERAAARVETQRARRRAAESVYEKAISDPALRSTDDAALFARACTDYARLYPGRRLAGCR